MPQSRQLAAIMFTDIVGYTALMGKDEQKAFEILRKNRELQKPLIKQYGGKWIKEIGDGVLASFSTVTDAVQCASEIQKTCTDINDFKLRIGIHLGEVVFEDHDVFGDGVNIASRIQALAPIGGIWISEAVYNNIANKNGINTKFIRAEILKNVKEPVRIHEIISGNEKEQQISSVTIKGTIKPVSEKSIAVLPFVNMSNDPEQEYFSDGMAEEIINSLVHIQDLKVAGRMSSFQFKGIKGDLREVGKKLGVNTVLEGSIRKQGNRIRITAQLINVEDGFHLWSEKYDRDMDDIFAIQDEIALTITEKLKITLLEKDREFITKIPTQNTEAYDLYLKGRFHINRRGSSILTGLQFFKQAIEADPDYALAYTGYANANFLSAVYSYFPGKQIMQKTKQAIETAIKLDNSQSESYFVLAQYYGELEFNWKEAEKYYLKSIELNPNFSQAHALYGMINLGFWQGKFEEAEKQGRLAIKVDPLMAINHADLAWTLYNAGRFEEALILAKTGIELDNNSFLSHRLAGLSHIELKHDEDAINTFKHLMISSNYNQHAVNGLIWAYCNNKQFEEARLLFNELKQRSNTEYIAGTYAGLSAAMLDSIDTAFDYLESAFSDHDPMLNMLKYSPYVPALLRNDPRFQNLLDRIGFPR